MNTKLLIEGKFVDGAGSAEPVLDSATGKTIATVREASSEQINAAVQAAEKAFFCTCKRSKTPPLCDGSHKALPPSA